MSIIDLRYGNVKPIQWAIDPGVVAYNASRMGLPMPFAYWAIWEGSGDKIYDLINQQIGVFQANAPSWEPRGLFFDQSLEEYVVVTTPKIQALGTGNYSLIVGIKDVSDNLTINAGVFTFGVYDPTWHIDAANKLKIYDAGSKVTSSGVVTSLTRQIGFIRRGIGANETEYYIDGQSAGTTTHANSIFQPSIVDIGWTHYSNEKMNGVIDYIYFVDQALTPSQVATIFVNPYGLIQQPRRIWAVAAAGTTVPPTTLAPTTSPVATTPLPTTLAPTTLPTTVAPTTLPTTSAPTTWQSTAPPTTKPPTTLAPTTLAPTEPPTTLAPTTLPTTAAPTTLPTTAAPTTLPTTVAPTTLPTTAIPTTLAPTTLPTTAVPTTVAPTTVAPTTIATTVAPTTLLTTLAPTTSPPTTLAPTTIAPTLAPTTIAAAEVCVLEFDSEIVNVLEFDSDISRILESNSEIVKTLEFTSEICKV